MKKIVFQIFCFSLFIAPVMAQRAKSVKTKKRVRNVHTEIYLRDVKKLPEVDEIEIIATKVIPASEYGKVDCRDPVNKCNYFGHLPMWELSKKTISGIEAIKLAKIWRSLESGSENGCFSPGYQLRFKKDGKLLLFTNICFSCCNATLHDGNIYSICGNRQIRKLKTMLTELVPH